MEIEGLRDFKRGDFTGQPGKLYHGVKKFTCDACNGLKFSTPELEFEDEQGRVIKICQRCEEKKPSRDTIK